MKNKTFDLINDTPDRITTLSTIGTDGSPNSAVIGSPFMSAEDQIWIGLGENRTLKNLQMNRKAVLLVMRPGGSLLEWKGARIYLELTAMEAEGARFDRMLDRIEASAGRLAARTIRKMCIFRITEIRPLLDIAG